MEQIEYRWVVKDHQIFLSNFKFDKTNLVNFTDFYMSPNNRVRRYNDLYTYIVSSSATISEIKITPERAIEYIIKSKYIVTKTAIGKFYLFGIQGTASLMNNSLQVSFLINKDSANKFEEQVLPRIPKNWVRIKSVYDFVYKETQFVKQRYTRNNIYLTEDPIYLTKDDDQQLMLDHNLLHNYFNSTRQIKGWNKSKIIRAHKIVVNEIQKRGLRHVPHDDLDKTLPTNLQQKIEIPQKK